jgi:hypothetical protein
MTNGVEVGTVSCLSSFAPRLYYQDTREHDKRNGGFHAE